MRRRDDPGRVVSPGSLFLSPLLSNHLQTHGKIEKGKDGKITWKFEKRPTSEALLKPLVGKLLGQFSTHRQ